jgi:four helix bundle protein
MDGARHYTELAVWRIGDQLRTEVFKLTGRPKFARDFRAQEQADDAVNSICRNIAEGFACETHGEFARYLSYSRRSLKRFATRCEVRGKRDTSAPRISESFNGWRSISVRRSLASSRFCVRRPM